MFSILWHLVGFTESIRQRFLGDMTLLQIEGVLKLEEPFIFWMMWKETN